MPSASSLVIRALKEPPRDRKKEKNIKHNKSVSLDEIIDIARTMRFKSFSKSLEGVVKEILGTAYSVGCQVDGKSPKAVSDAIGAGEIDSESQSHTCASSAGRCFWPDDADKSLQFLRNKCSIMRKCGLGFSACQGVQGLLFKKLRYGRSEKERQ